MDMPGAYLTCWEKYHGFYLAKRLFTSKGNVSRGSELAQLRAASEPTAVTKPTVIRQISMPGGDTRPNEVGQDRNVTGHDGELRGSVTFGVEEWQDERMQRAGCGDAVPTQSHTNAVVDEPDRSKSAIACGPVTRNVNTMPSVATVFIATGSSEFKSLANHIVCGP